MAVLPSLVALSHRRAPKIYLTLLGHERPVAMARCALAKLSEVALG